MSITRRLTRVPRFVRKYLLASQALAYAERRSAPGTEFARFGRRIGMRLIPGATSLAASYLLTPVSITRYFEFEFASENIPADAEHCLDVSSPRLFSLFVASRRPSANIEMLNPDGADAATTTAVAARLGYANLAVASLPVGALAERIERYDCIWSISVVEHVIERADGDEGDMQAMRLMYDALRPGGRLIVTVPVDRSYWIEYRDQDYYGLNTSPTASGKYFFQRLYDEQTIRSRLVEPLGREPTYMAWFGERVSGVFQAYERAWIANGPDETLEDPRRIADEYDAYESWASMPGFGVCGIVIDKPGGPREAPRP